LVIAPALDFMLSSPFARLRILLDPNAESSLATWYSSAQWLAAGLLFALLAWRALQVRAHGFLPVAALALLCAAFSAEEIVQIHEWLGQRSDALLPGGDRANTALWRTGVWPFVIGAPVLGLLVMLLIGARRVFARAPRALPLLAIGLAVMFTGALVVELAVNFIEAGSGERALLLLQHLCEEFLEMLGVTFIVWAAYELLLSYGFALVRPAQLHIQTAPSRGRARGSNPAAGRTMLSG
jgi:hypothetical protein